MFGGKEKQSHNSHMSYSHNNAVLFVFDIFVNKGATMNSPDKNAILLPYPKWIRQSASVSFELSCSSQTPFRETFCSYHFTAVVK